MKDELVTEITEQFLRDQDYFFYDGCWNKYFIKVYLEFGPYVKLNEIKTKIRYEHELLMLEKLVL